MHHPDLAEEKKQETFRILAFDNATKATKQILVNLPKEAGVDEMVARVERAEPQEKSRSIVAAVQEAMKEVVRPLVAVVQRRGPPALYV